MPLAGLVLFPLAEPIRKILRFFAESRKLIFPFLECCFRGGSLFMKYKEAP